MGGSWRACAALLAAIAGPLGSAAAEPSLEARAVAALRFAAAASTGGDAAAAAARFDEAAALAEIAGPARVLAARAWLAARRPDAAEASARGALERDTGPPWDADLFEALARARREQGDAAGARRAWREALARGVEPERAAEIRLAIAASINAGDIDAIATELRAAWIEGVPYAASDRAEEQLAALEHRSGRSLRSADDWSARADRLFESQRTDAALRAYQATLQASEAGGRSAADSAGASDPLRRHAAERRGECLFRSRRYTEAVSVFATLANDPEAAVWRARALARAGHVDEALAAFGTIAASAPRATAASASYLAGLLHEGRGRDEAARAAFAAAAAGGEGKVATDALWRLGFGAYRARDSAAARRDLGALAARQSDPLDQLAARYWRARAQERDADRNADLAAIAGEFPFSYYGVRAAALAPAKSESGRRVLDDAPVTLREADLLVARVLAAAGLGASALRETAWLEAKATSLRDRLAIARVYAAAGQPDRAQALLVKRDAESLARGPIPGLEELWRLAWPDAFAHERRAARPRDAALDPWLVAALMREESGYRKDAVSVTGALGLLQLMPGTAEQVARRAGIPPFARERLLDPAFNIRLATLHLEELAARFPGRADAIAAAYNAGAGAVAEWRRDAPDDSAEWIETIPYDETRGYVKRVLRSLHVYQELYR